MPWLITAFYPSVCTVNSRGIDNNVLYEIVSLRSMRPFGIKHVTLPYLLKRRACGEENCHLFRSHPVVL
jgi:hypothetical protein